MMMKIYFSVVPEVAGGESIENLKKLMHFLQDQGHVVYRAPYILSEDPNQFLQKELGFDREPNYTEQREAHMKWIDNADILLADLSVISEGRSMIIQRAIDKPEMGLPNTPIILIKGKKFNRRIGKLTSGLIESSKVIYYEYNNIDEVINNWQGLLQKSHES
ncbi:MAG: hypothetical protein ACE5J7_01660 [Candidatus Aenigmatarchaeota archaeon]